MFPSLRTISLCSWLALCLPLTAGAQSEAATYALLVGSNPGGDGQAELRYAEEDARRMAEVLTQLGRFPPAQTRVLLRPNRARLFEALDQVAVRLAAHHAQGEQAQFVFYYSGHARASSIQLAGEELLLGELRERVLRLPTTLTLIVLDACQSGAFSNVKGAQPAAAFSYNSVSRLRTSGVAVIASSSASELSQESDTLHGSYFTHHLMVALRGAGDRDRDGVVSLAEAYRYAYDRTLAATSRTAVGGQHVTLQTELTGQGEVPITYPAQSGAQLELPAELEADLIVEHEGVVVAELHKVRGGNLTLALPGGAYTAVLRRPSELRECRFTLVDGRATRLLPDSCEAISEDIARAKGYTATERDEGPPGDSARHEAWALELMLGLGGTSDDAYTQRLEDFGFHTVPGLGWRFQLAVSRQLNPYLSVVFDFRNLESAQYERDLQSTEHESIEHYDWWSYGVNANLRGHIDAVSDVLRFYAQLGAGLGLAHSKLQEDAETEFGPVFSASTGIIYMPWSYVGAVLSLTYSYAPLLRNELDESRNSGGLQLGLGLRFRTWRQP